MWTVTLGGDATTFDVALKDVSGDMQRGFGMRILKRVGSGKRKSHVDPYGQQIVDNVHTKCLPQYLPKDTCRIFWVATLLHRRPPFEW